MVTCILFFVSSPKVPSHSTNTFCSFGCDVCNIHCVWACGINGVHTDGPSQFSYFLRQAYLNIFTHIHAVTSILKNGLVDHHGKAVAVTRGFLTSEENLHGAILMDKFHIALSDGIRPLNTSKLFRKWMDTHFSRKVVEVMKRVAWHLWNEKNLMPNISFEVQCITLYGLVILR